MRSAVLKKSAVTIQPNYEERRFRQTSIFAYKMLLPSILFIAVFIAFPLLYSVSLAFQGFKYGVPTGEFIGFQNFIDIFTRPSVAPGFYNSVRLTMLFTGAAVIAVIAVSMGIAFLINENFRGSGLIKVSLLLPYAIPGIASAVIWTWIYDANFGVLNGLLSSLGIIDTYITILADKRFALWAIWFAYVWKMVPYSSFLLSAGLSTIPSSVYEAARMDRSGRFRTFFKITLPLLMPVLQLALVVQTIFALLLHFGLVFVMTGGGPGDTTRTLPWLIYQESFTYTRFGRGSAMAIILSLIMIVFIYAYLVLLDPERRKAQS
jgi:multiple sugar transport system permease protein